MKYLQVFINSMVKQIINLHFVGNIYLIFIIIIINMKSLSVSINRII